VNLRSQISLISRNNGLITQGKQILAVYTVEVDNGPMVGNFVPKAADNVFSPDSPDERMNFMNLCQPGLSSDLRVIWRIRT
jgi:hypothetical protein